MNDAGGGVDDHAPTTRVHAGFDGCVQITALCADARNEDGHVATDSPNNTQILRIRRTDDQRAVAVFVPVVSHVVREQAMHGE